MRRRCRRPSIKRGPSTAFGSRLTSLRMTVHIRKGKRTANKTKSRWLLLEESLTADDGNQTSGFTGVRHR